MTKIVLTIVAVLALATAMVSEADAKKRKCRSGKVWSAVAGKCVPRLPKPRKTTPRGSFF